MKPKKKKTKNKKKSRKKGTSTADGYYVANGKVHVLRKGWVFGI